MNPEFTELKDFLGFDLYKWLKETPVSRLIALFNTLLEAKLINYKMIRTLTNLADITPSVRNAMQPIQREALLDVVGVEYKPTREGLIWTYAVSYVFIRNICKYMRLHPKAYLKAPSLKPFYEYDTARLSVKYSSGVVLKNAMQILQAYPKFAYQVYTNFDKVTFACALQVLHADDITSLLQKVATQAFSNDIVQLSKSPIPAKDQYSIVSSQCKFLDFIFSVKAKSLDKKAILSILWSLEDERFSICLYNANLLDFGMYLRTNKIDRTNELFSSLQTRMPESLHYIIMATYEKKFNINYDEDLFFGSLASQLFQQSAASGIPRNFGDYFIAME